MFPFLKIGNVEGRNVETAKEAPVCSCAIKTHPLTTHPLTTHHSPLPQITSVALKCSRIENVCSDNQMVSWKPLNADKRCMQLGRVPSERGKNDPKWKSCALFNSAFLLTLFLLQRVIPSAYTIFISSPGRYPLSRPPTPPPQKGKSRT